MSNEPPQVRLATRRNGTRDGELMLVSPDLTRWIAVPTIAQTLQHALDDWARTSPQLDARYRELTATQWRDAEPYEAASALAPLPRAGRLPGPESLTPRLVRSLPAPLRDVYVHAYAAAMPRIFLYLVPVLAAGVLTAFLLKENPLVTQPDARSDPYGFDATIPTPRATGGGTGVPLCGIVRHSDGTTVARAALTLIDASGRQVGRGATGERISTEPSARRSISTSVGPRRKAR